MRKRRESASFFEVLLVLVLSDQARYSWLRISVSRFPTELHLGPAKKGSQNLNI